MDAVIGWGRWRSRGLREQSKDLLANAQRQPAALQEHMLPSGGGERLGETGKPSTPPPARQYGLSCASDQPPRPQAARKTAMKAGREGKWCEKIQREGVGGREEKRDEGDLEWRAIRSEPSGRGCHYTSELDGQTSVTVCGRPCSHEANFHPSRKKRRLA